MRIFGKVCAFVAAAMLVLQAICVFCGYPLHGVAGGVELITLAAWCVTDGIVYFKKPKHPYLRFKFIYVDGSAEGFITRADKASTTRLGTHEPFDTLNISYFESEKDEVSDG
mgnify:CR=1 FL=1